MPFATFLLAMVQPLIARILVTVGFSLVTFTGMTVLFDTLTAQAVSAWGGLPATILQLAGLAGIGEALSIITGAIATRILIWQLTKSSQFLSTNA